LARRGDYLGRPVMEIGLASRGSAENKSSSIYVLTDRGKRIAQSDDQETRERLLAEALLGFYPIRREGNDGVQLYIPQIYAN